MNKLLLNAFGVLFPFYPLLAWAFHFVNDKPMSFYLNLLMLPLALYLLVTAPNRLPKYVVYFLLFTLYHVGSTFITDTIPKDQNKIFFIFADFNVVACSYLIIMANTVFDEKFMRRMNRNIFIIVIISLLVSIVQIKDPMFFFNTAIDMESYVGAEDTRNASIYSWTGINSSGITFPVLIAILLNFYRPGSRAFILIVISGIVVSFLTRARFVMLSALVVFSQLIFARGVSLFKAISLIAVFVGGLYAMIYVSGELGFDVEEVISSRILEKDNEMGSAKARVTSYEVFLKVFPENPVFGVGPETRQDVKDLLGDEAPMIHVGYLSYLYFYGIIGSSLLFLALYHMMRNAWQVGKTHGFWGSFYGLVAFAFANATFVYFNFSEMGILLAAMYLYYYNSIYPVTENETTEPGKEGEAGTRFIYT